MLSRKEVVRAWPSAAPTVARSADLLATAETIPSIAVPTPATLSPMPTINPSIVYCPTSCMTVDGDWMPKMLLILPVIASVTSVILFFRASILLWMPLMRPWIISLPHSKAVDGNALIYFHACSKPSTTADLTFGTVVVTPSFIDINIFVAYCFNRDGRVVNQVKIDSQVLFMVAIKVVVKEITDVLSVSHAVDAAVLISVHKVLKNVFRPFHIVSAVVFILFQVVEKKSFIPFHMFVVLVLICSHAVSIKALIASTVPVNISFMPSHICLKDAFRLLNIPSASDLNRVKLPVTRSINRSTIPSTKFFMTSQIPVKTVLNPFIISVIPVLILL